MVNLKLIISLGLIVAFLAFGGVSILSQAKVKAGELKTSLDTKIQETKSRRLNL